MTVGIPLHMCICDNMNEAAVFNIQLFFVSYNCIDFFFFLMLAEII